MIKETPKAAQASIPQREDLPPDLWLAAIRSRIEDFAQRLVVLSNKKETPRFQSSHRQAKIGQINCLERSKCIVIQEISDNKQRTPN